MHSHRSFPGAALGALLLACTAPRQAPVPLVGAARDVAALEGQWDGSYSSAENGRSGSISFTLTATRDSAFGDVVMIPRGLGRPLQAWNNGAAPSGAAAPRPAVLTINFVRVAEGRVTGTLAPYADPETGVQAVHGIRRAVAGGRDRRDLHNPGRPRCRQPDGRVEGDAPETLDQLFPSRATVGLANAGAGEAGSPRCSRARFNASSMFP